MRFPYCRLAAALLLSAAVAACSDSPTEPSAEFTVPYAATELRVGTGAEATTGSVATANLTYWLYSETAADNKGQRIDTTEVTFTIGSSSIIQGLSTTVRGMRVGGMRRAIVPPNLAFGAEGTGTVPPNATLVFEVELLNVQ